MVAVTLSQIIVVTINVIFLIFGLAALIVGIIFKVGWDEVRDAFVEKASDVDIDLSTAGDTLAYASIIFGAIIIVIAILGCVGACCKVRLLLVIYAIILLLLIIGEVAAVVLLAVKGNVAKEEIDIYLSKRLLSYREDSTDKESRAFSALFHTLECCGISNNTNWTKVHFIPAPERNQTQYPPIIPITCCKGFNFESTLTMTNFDNHTACLRTPAPDNAYTEDCETKVINLVEDNKVTFIAVGVTILVIELLMVILAFFVCSRHDED